MGANKSNGRRGAILVSVLWILVFLGFLAVVLRTQMTGVVASVRVTEDKASARILAEAGLAQAAAEIRAGPLEGKEQLEDEISSRMILPAGQATVTARNEALRIDLNTAERPLIVGALLAGGATRGAADDLATRIIARRPPPPQPDQPDPPADKNGFQTVAELAFLPGMPTDIAIGVEPYVTVSSGLTGVRLAELEDTVLSDIPGLPSSVLKAVEDYRAARISRRELDQALSAVTYNATELAPTWRVELNARLPSGYSEAFEALVLVAAAEETPYRVLDWRRVPAGGE